MITGVLVGAVLGIGAMWLADWAVERWLVPPDRAVIDPAEREIQRQRIRAIRDAAERGHKSRDGTG